MGMRTGTARRTRPRSRAGYTLVEAMVTVGVLSMLMTAVGSMLIMGMKTYTIQRNNYEASSNASMSMALALRDVADGVMVLETTADQLVYQKPLLGDDGTYELDTMGGIAVKVTAVRLGDKMKICKLDNAVYLVNMTTGAEPVEVATNVQSLSFLYDGQDPNVVAIPPPDVRSITMIIETSYTETNVTASSVVQKTVRLRNHL